MQQYYREVAKQRDICKIWNPKVNNLLLDLRVVKYILSLKYQFM